MTRLIACDSRFFLLEGSERSVHRLYICIHCCIPIVISVSQINVLSANGKATILGHFASFFREREKIKAIVKERKERD